MKNTLHIRKNILNKKNTAIAAAGTSAILVGCFGIFKIFKKKDKNKKKKLMNTINK